MPHRGVEPEQFVRPTTPEVAYILGFLWADGWVSKDHPFIRTEILETDANDLVPVFMATGKWGISSRSRPGRRRQTTFATTGRDLHRHFVQLGFCEKDRVSAKQVIDSVPAKFRHYWARGLFDGDGCIYTNQKQSLAHVTIAGAFAQDWAGVLDLFATAGVHFKISRRIHKSTGGRTRDSILRISKRSEVMRLRDYIYQGKTFGIVRKREALLNVQPPARPWAIRKLQRGDKGR